jgi:imidazolonepropionase-like amidohydrolase
VLVSEEKIQSVGSAAPAGATVIDLGDATLTPGFIDAHTHLTDDFNPDYNGASLLSLQRTIPEKAIRATANARVTLMSGFTTVRDVGSSDFLDVGLRNSINAGIVPGPRMLISVHALGSTGGHCDDSDGLRPGVFDHESGPQDGVINSPDEARFAVRYNIKYGADVIKICASARPQCLSGAHSDGPKRPGRIEIPASRQSQSGQGSEAARHHGQARRRVGREDCAGDRCRCLPAWQQRRRVSTYGG